MERQHRMSCPHQINGECWCEKYMQSVYNLPPVIKLYSGNIRTISWMDDKATKENTNFWAGRTRYIEVVEEATIDDILGSSL